MLEKAEEWRALLRKHAPIARQMVRKLVEGRIVFAPDREAGLYRFTVPGTLGDFFSGIVQPLALASPAGVVPAWSRQIPGEVPAAAAREGPRSGIKSAQPVKRAPTIADSMAR